jgi:hypothetical protein
MVRSSSASSRTGCVKRHGARERGLAPGAGVSFCWQKVEQKELGNRRQVIPPFDPKTFRSDHKVTRWVPRQQVRFDKPFGLGGIALAIPLLAATVLFLLVGPAALLRDGLHPRPSAPHPVLAALLLVLFGGPRLSEISSSNR